MMKVTLIKIYYFFTKWIYELFSILFYCIQNMLFVSVFTGCIPLFVFGHPLVACTHFQKNK